MNRFPIGGVKRDDFDWSISILNANPHHTGFMTVPKEVGLFSCSNFVGLSDFALSNIVFRESIIIVSEGRIRFLFRWSNSISGDCGWQFGDSCCVSTWWAHLNQGEIWSIQIKEVCLGWESDRLHCQSCETRTLLASTDAVDYLLDAWVGLYCKHADSVRVCR